MMKCRQGVDGMDTGDIDFEKIKEHYRHACEKHPGFCYRMLPDWPPEDIRREIDNNLGFARKRCARGAELGNLMWNEILDEEVWEISEALLQGNKEHAAYEAYDAIAVLLRVIDVLEGRQKLATRTEKQKKEFERHGS